MGQHCEFCEKKPSFGNTLEQRGKPKYLGGNGRKTTGITRRVFRPNLQTVRIQDGTSSRKARVCAKCLRTGVVTKRVVRAPFELPSAN